MTSEEIKQKILDSLAKTNFGKSIKKISEELKLSRTTVSKYLSLMKQEGLTTDKKLGVYSIWFSTEKIKELEESPYRILIRDFYKNLLLALSKMYPDIIERGKELGNLLAQNLQIEKFVDLSVIPPSNNSTDKKLLVRIILEIFQNSDILGERTESEIFVLENQGVIRIKNSEFLDRPLHFYIQTGFLEAKVQPYISFPIQVEVYEINTQENYCDILVKLGDQ